jgi:transposase-like protein
MKKEEEFDFKEFEKEAIERLKEGAPLSGQGGIFTPLIKRILEASLEGELDSHLELDEEINRRNGRIGKTLKTSLGNVDLQTPRDRNGSFEPQIVRKRQRVLNEELDQKIISLYGLGLSYSDIRKHLQEMYGLETSEATLTSVTDRIIEEVKEWQHRPLESVYPIVWLDAVHFKVKEEGRIVNKAVYCVMGANREGLKDILGMYLGHSEGAAYWLGVMSDLRSRGIQDIFIACIDNLKGFAEAIEASFPDADVQLCIVHQVRNTMRFVPDKESRVVVRDMKQIYQAPNKEASISALDAFCAKWGSKYPYSTKSWTLNWERLSNFYKYPPEIRKLIYTTNVIENFNGRLRKVTKTKRVFSSDMALMKLLYLIQKQFVEDNWQTPIFGWRTIQSQLSIIFDERFTK